MFLKNWQLRISEKTESAGSFKWTFALLQTLAYTERLKKPLIKVKKYKKCASAPKILKSSMSAKPYVRIFRTSPVWQEHKSPDFLVKPCLQKTQKSGFYGVWILSKPLYFLFFKIRLKEVISSQWLQVIKMILTRSLFCHQHRPTMSPTSAKPMTVSECCFQYKNDQAIEIKLPESVMRSILGDWIFVWPRWIFDNRTVRSEQGSSTIIYEKGFLRTQTQDQQSDL